MQEIKNPFAENKNFNCFACSPNNPNGLHLRFFKDGDTVFTKWNPQTQFEGYQGLIHGGIQATILDEVASWCVNIMLHTSGLTSQISVKYHKPVYSNILEIIATAKVASVKGRYATIHTELKDKNGILYSESEVLYYLMSKETSQIKYNYPEDEKKFFSLKHVKNYKSTL